MERLRASTADVSTSLKLSEGKVAELQNTLRKTKAQLADALSELDVTQHEIVPLRKCVLLAFVQLNTVAEILNHLRQELLGKQEINLNNSRILPPQKKNHQVVQ
jgi:hypothetical protein